MKIHDPAMTFKDDEAKALWEQGVEKNQDPYGEGVYRFASEWATRMEARVKETEGTLTIKDIAEACSREADDEGITGFMYGCAISILAGCWVYGEDLRVWHNLDTQIGDEGERANESGGVLNPALLSIGG